MNFIEWWNTLGGYRQVLYVVAALSSLILLIQLILALFGFARGADADVGGDISGDGFDAGGGHDVGGGDIDTPDVGPDVHAGHGHGDAGAGLRIFTVQGLISFFVMFSWSCIAFISVGMPEGLATIIAFVLGAAALLLMAKLMQLMLKLQDSGNIDLAGAAGLIGQVYIPIPSHENGIGKVMLTLQSRFIECDAITRGDALLKTDTFVKVVEVRGTTLIVEKSNAEQTIGES
ncbi:MAG: hypothetical protein LBL66_04765 [Clostridiales bacterium]|jgi:membrane protein implicated in regulation of membrane protease activity|nr:hypothetical protein [Clostridiales bacterium]